MDDDNWTEAEKAEDEATVITFCEALYERDDISRVIGMLLTAIKVIMLHAPIRIRYNFYRYIAEVLELDKTPNRVEFTLANWTPEPGRKES